MEIKNKLREQRPNGEKIRNQHEKYYKISYNSILKRRQCAQNGSCDVIDEKCKQTANFKWK